MFTYIVWDDFVISEYKKNGLNLELFDIIIAMLFSIITIPIDIIISPIEIISKIIYLILKNKCKKREKR